jgi:hypothetical protein
MSRVFLPLAGLVATLLILAALRLLNIASP